MVFKRVKTIFSKPTKNLHRFKIALEKGLYQCESCGFEEALATLPALEFRKCPKCGFNNFIPYHIREFLLFAPLGIGGYSSIYKAIRREDEKSLFAVKLLRTDREFDESEVQAFLYEAEVHRSVTAHPHIVEYVEHGELEGERYYAIRFIPGTTVKKIVEEQGRISEIDTATWMLQVLEALIHIRNHGYLYRDVSPSNIMIQDAGRNACLIDFGLALPLDEAEREKAQSFVEGTAEYIPPERIQGRGEDERSVIYSLGLLMFFMLKGESYIKAGDQKASALKHVQGLRVAYNERLLPDNSEPLAHLVGRMIASDPDERPETFEAMIKLLGAMVG